MGNILFQNQKPSDPNKGNQVLNMMKGIRSMGPSEAIFKSMYSNNPEFRAFADSVRDIGPEAAFRQNGLDFEQFRNYRW